MKKRFVLFAYFLFVLNGVFCQTIINSLDNKQSVLITVAPISARFTDDSQRHTYELTKVDTSYFVVFTKESKVLKQELSKDELKLFNSYADKLKNKSYVTTSSHDDVVIKMGDESKSYSAIFHSDTKLLDLLFKNEKDKWWK